MGLTKEALIEILDYSAWASSRLLEAVRDLPPEELERDFGTADRSVLGTLVHVFAGDRIWLRRVQGRPIAPFLEESDKALSALLENWPVVHAEWRAWADGLTPESIGEAILYQDLRRREWKHDPAQIVQHVVNHATHHRGQVSGFLRVMGHTPPVLDLMVYYREKSS